MCVCTLTYTYAQIHIYFCIYLFAYFKTWVYIDTSESNLVPQGSVLAFSPSLICNVFFQQWETLSDIMYNTLTCLFNSGLYIVSVLLAHTAAGNTFTNQCSVTMFSNFVFSLTLSSQNSAFQSYLSRFLSFPPPSVQLCRSFKLQLKSFVTVYLPSLVPSTS